VVFSPALRGEERRPLVVALHPLLSEFAGRLAGEAAEVINILPPNANVHTFEPTPGDMARMQQATLVLAMGKHLEGYLDRLKENLPDGVEIYEVGRLVPSVTIDPTNEVFACCPEHSHGAIDPHWWHSPLAVRRAVRHLGRELEKRFPQHKSGIRDRSNELMNELEELHEWTENQLAVIPRGDRKLVTAHAAFGYFCTEYAFQSIPVQGLTAERNPSPATLAETIDILREENIKVVFPETKASNAILQSLRESTGVKPGSSLYADFLDGEPYIDMFKSNIASIRKALADSDSR
jgi:zinc/manganese transport system substrate-binding protein